jgi:hypothetical protein
MAEDTWLKIQREYFVDTEATDLDIVPKKLNKAIERYNRCLQKVLLGESPYIAEDLKMTILKAGETNDNKN